MRTVKWVHKILKYFVLKPRLLLPEQFRSHRTAMNRLTTFVVAKSRLSWTCTGSLHAAECNCKRNVKVARRGWRVPVQLCLVESRWDSDSFWNRFFPRASCYCKQFLSLPLKSSFKASTSAAFCFSSRPFCLSLKFSLACGLAVSIEVLSKASSSVLHASKASLTAASSRSHATFLFMLLRKPSFPRIDSVLHSSHGQR